MVMKVMMMMMMKTEWKKEEGKEEVSINLQSLHLQRKAGDPRGLGDQALLENTTCRSEAGGVRFRPPVSPIRRVTPARFSPESK